MRKANIIVIGKTGAGKSTLINSLLGERVADTGMGTAITQENKKYDRQIIAIDGLPINISVYDTVGLELDKKVTSNSVSNIEEYLERTDKECADNEVLCVWYCINMRGNRLEQYELDLIKKFRDKCIPVVIVITQCIDNTDRELELKIKDLLSETPVVCVLAEDYRNRIGVFRAYGVQELLEITVTVYPTLKLKMAKERIDKLVYDQEAQKMKLNGEGKNCVEKYAKKAETMCWIPGLCVQVMRNIRNEMIDELCQIVGINESRDSFDLMFRDSYERLMLVPFMSMKVAKDYIYKLGMAYIDLGVDYVEKYSRIEIEKMQAVIKAIKSQTE